VFSAGKQAMTLRGAGIAGECTRVVEDYIVRRFGGGAKGEAAE
jgi:(E)-4-hydroxy-3-methylbut-2-enyl-diphosphate synthase